MAYSADLRQRVLDKYDQGKKTAQISRELNVSPAYARRVKQHRHAPRKKIGGGKPKLDAGARATLGGWVAQKPDATLEELRRRIAEELSITLSIGCLWNTLRAMKLTFKKSR
jgi:transposase